MSRSANHACGRSCGVCNPHKKWRGNRLVNRTPQEQRQSETHQLDPSVERELDATDAIDEGGDWTIDWWLDWLFENEPPPPSSGRIHQPADRELDAETVALVGPEFMARLHEAVDSLQPITPKALAAAREGPEVAGGVDHEPADAQGEGKA